ncbi:uncharacterized protein LOC123037516 [Drosophila rhopaloa]|uniref:Uncharacterized protein n=1 Tax=Drosophila rhopaloa TaxID=1041015 RepID=A0ABM5J6R5_DRORH|nr:uncharacterized protein LOC123037516 [Drosophila rhopaloa]
MDVDVDVDEDVHVDVAKMRLRKGSRSCSWTLAGILMGWPVLKLYAEIVEQQHKIIARIFAITILLLHFLHTAKGASLFDSLAGSSGTNLGTNIPIISNLSKGLSSLTPGEKNMIALLNPNLYRALQILEPLLQLLSG